MRRLAPPPRGALPLVVLALFGPPAAGAADDPLPSDPIFRFTTAAGESFDGQVGSVGPDGTISVRSGPDREQARDLPVASLFKVDQFDPPPAPSAGPQATLYLAGGDRVRGRLLALADDVVRFRSASLGPIEVPVEAVLGVVEPSADPPEELDRLGRSILDDPRQADVVRLANGDRLTGTVVAVDEQRATLDRPGGELTLDRAQIRSIALDPTLARPGRLTAPGLELHLTDGSRLTGVAGPLRDGRLSLASVHGPELAVPLADLRLAYALGGSTRFLTDDEPAAVEYLGYVGPVLPMAVDRDALGGPLTLAGVVYPRGIGTQSRTLIAYRLRDTDRRFQALVGVDDRAGEHGSVIFRVLLGGRPAFESPVLRAGDPPLAIDLETQGAPFLILLTEFGPEGSVQDYADWIEPRVVE